MPYSKKPISHYYAVVPWGEDLPDLYKVCKLDIETGLEAEVYLVNYDRKDLGGAETTCDCLGFYNRRSLDPTSHKHVAIVKQYLKEHRPQDVGYVWMPKEQRVLTIKLY